MTEEQKQMKKYMNAIERRLNLPLEVRSRVMSDLQSSIQSRREAGQTDEQIRAELGSPKEVAEELNEQMKEFAYAKSKWRWAALAAAVLGGVMLAFNGLVGLLTWLLNLTINESASVGIIGGADGPTAIFVTSSWTVWDMVPWVLVLAMGILGFRKLSRLKQEK